MQSASPARVVVVRAGVVVASKRLHPGARAAPGGRGHGANARGVGTAEDGGVRVYLERRERARSGGKGRGGKGRGAGQRRENQRLDLAPSTDKTEPQGPKGRSPAAMPGQGRSPTSRTRGPCLSTKQGGPVTATPNPTYPPNLRDPKAKGQAHPQVGGQAKPQPATASLPYRCGQGPLLHPLGLFHPLQGCGRAP